MPLLSVKEMCFLIGSPPGCQSESRDYQPSDLPPSLPSLPGLLWPASPAPQPSGQHPPHPLPAHLPWAGPGRLPMWEGHPCLHFFWGSRIPNRTQDTGRFPTRRISGLSQDMNPHLRARPAAAAGLSSRCACRCPSRLLSEPLQEVCPPVLLGSGMPPSPEAPEIPFLILLCPASCRTHRPRS